MLEVDLTKESFKERLDSFSKRQKPAKGRELPSREALLAAPVSLHEHLTGQAPLYFETSQDLHLAHLMIGHLDEKGFLTNPLSEIAPNLSEATLNRILSTLQTFDPLESVREIHRSPFSSN